ncbi:hypothetical protein [Fodinibius sp. AD559]|uniref:hypothetical protein n=1 Tax=Fodinibius sp. AD559 TaxID=3424179 RepID=UPI004046E2AA
MTLLEFDKHLIDKITDEGWPFICEGSKLECNVFIVGITPSKSVSFQNHWYPQKDGFNRRGWMDAYDEQEDKFTYTRNQLNRIYDEFDESRNIRLLETNLYNIASTSKENLADNKKSTEVFNFLLRSIKPKAVIGHGKDTIRYLRHLSGNYYEKDVWKEVELFDLSTNMYLRDHLSFHTSKEDCGGFVSFPIFRTTQK